MIGKPTGSGWCLCLAMFAMGCAGTVAGEDSDNSASFVGHWISTSNVSMNSCSGRLEGDGGYRIELREGKESDLEFLELSPFEAGKVGCIQQFDVRDGVAHLDGDQACDYEYPAQDPDADESATVTTHVVYSSDRIELTSANTLAEEGASHYENDVGDTCKTTFEVEYERTED